VDGEGLLPVTDDAAFADVRETFSTLPETLKPPAVVVRSETEDVSDATCRMLLAATDDATDSRGGGAGLSEASADRTAGGVAGLRTEVSLPPAPFASAGCPQLLQTTSSSAIGIWQLLQKREFSDAAITLLDDLGIRRGGRMGFGQRVQGGLENALESVGVFRSHTLDFIGVSSGRLRTRNFR